MFTEEYCCAGGPQTGGNKECWDAFNNFEKCCTDYVKRMYPFGDLLHGVHGVPFEHHEFGYNVNWTAHSALANVALQYRY